MRYQPKEMLYISGAFVTFFVNPLQQGGRVVIQKNHCTSRTLQSTNFHSRSLTAPSPPPFTLAPLP